MYAQCNVAICVGLYFAVFNQFADIQFACRYSKVLFVDVEALKEETAAKPMEPIQFEALVKQQCAEAREILSTK